MHVLVVCTAHWDFHTLHHSPHSFQHRGKKSVTALLVSDALVMPRETLVLPEPLAKRPLQTGARDLAVAKHLSTLAASGKW